MHNLTGTGALIRLILRRDRIVLPVWIVAIVALVYSQAVSIKDVYTTPSQLEGLARTGDNPAFVAMLGPKYALDTVPGQTVWQISAFGAIFVGLMCMMLVGRHTRAEEESGRSELLRAAVLGRYAEPFATLIVVTAANVVIGLLSAASFIGVDFPVEGSLAFGALLAGAGFVFTGAALVAAQITENTRVVYGVTGAVIAASYVLRAAGDVGNGTLSWLSPIGWGQAMRPYADERWWPLLISVGATVVLVGAAFALIGRRDVGAGLVRPRPGPATASRSTTSAFGFAFRLQRGTLIGWAIGLFLGGLAYGSVVQNLDDLIGDNPDVEKILLQNGGTSLIDSFMGTAMMLLAMISTGYAIQAALRLRSEEAAGRAEPLLATAVSRWRWAGTHLLVVLIGTVVVVGLGGLGTGIAAAVALDDGSYVWQLLGAGLNHLPAVLVLAAVAVILFGVVPRVVYLAWAVLGVVIAIGFLGPLLDLPRWALDLSPFLHTPQLPAVAFDAVPLAWMAGIAVVLTVGGLAAFRRRDIG